ncbi:hypothetical protein K4L44_00020 [Halosquirtibacter laminarini]|uniref:Uncharacterized protein n=1 Tax=Halosquirtibacter laminarini TaxID=3374600 RepID=A0AC61NFG0_9BACT|nr:hypothetical protein K4L44_00020 [Prolixibacteraceae bacterium]
MKLSILVNVQYNKCSHLKQKKSLCVQMKKMMKQLLIFALVFLLISCQKQNTMHIDTILSFHSQYIQDRNIDIWLPNGYNSKERYQVLYMHDGQMLFDSTKTWNHQSWNAGVVVQKLINQKEIPPTIIVAISNIQDYRTSDYWPQKAFELLPRTVQDSLIKYRLHRYPESDNYLKFIVEELKPYIDKTYSTRPGKKHTFIAGSSMGGLISMYAICEYPDIFYSAACLSTHWIGGYKKNNLIPSTFVTYIQRHMPSPQSHKIYFDHGTKTLDANYEAYQESVNKLFESAGYNSTNLMSIVFKGDKHKEKYWAQRLHIPLQFILNN